MPPAVDNDDEMGEAAVVEEMELDVVGGEQADEEGEVAVVGGEHADEEGELAVGELAVDKIIVGAVGGKNGIAAGEQGRFDDVDDMNEVIDDPYDRNLDDILTKACDDINDNSNGKTDDTTNKNYIEVKMKNNNVGKPRTVGLQ